MDLSYHNNIEGDQQVEFRRFPDLKSQLIKSTNNYAHQLTLEEIILTC